jgi:hypothetical protein
MVLTSLLPWSRTLSVDTTTGLASDVAAELWTGGANFSWWVGHGS